MLKVYFGSVILIDPSVLLAKSDTRICPHARTVKFTACPCAQVRNISRHDVTVKELFLKHIDALAAALLTDIDDDMLVEILGVFGNLIIPDLDYQQLLEEYSLLDFINEKLLPSAADDDIVLQLLILVSRTKDAVGITLPQSVELAQYFLHKKIGLIFFTYPQRTDFLASFVSYPIERVKASEPTLRTQYCCHSMYC